MIHVARGRGPLGIAFGLALGAAAAASPAAAQEAAGAGYPASLFNSFSYRNIGPNRGGRSIAVGASVARPLEYWFGATGGGLWKSVNGGTDWAPVTDGKIGSASVGAIGVCEAHPDVVYIGTGEAQLRNSINTGDGAYRTTDAGQTWTKIGLSSSTGQVAIARLRVHPQDCDLVYAAVLGDPYGPNPERGVFRSKDGGRTWEQVLFRSDRAGANDLSIDPADPRVLYATIWDVNRNPWRAQDGPASGLFKSTDGGDTWTELTRNPGLPTGRIGKLGVSVSPADPRRVYLVVAAEPGGGVYRSDDGGATWSQTSGHRSLFVREEYYIRIVADPQNRDRVYVLNASFYRSDDGGRTFVSVRVPHGDNHDLWIDPRDARRMVQANDGGANVSVDGGRTWTEQDYPTAQLYHVATTSHFPYHVCGAQQDNSTACVPSDGDGSYFYHVAGGESGYIAPHAKNRDLFYAGAIRGFITRYDRSSGQARDIEVWPDNPQGLPASRVRERFQWTFPIVLSPLDPDVVYVGSQHVWRTRDGGHTWDKLSPDLTRNDPRTLQGEELIARDQNSQDYYATLFTLAPSRQEADVVWTGSDDGLVHVTRDGGKSWQNVTPRDLPAQARSSMIEASPHRAGKAYYAAYRYKLQDVAPYAYRTDDYGKTWTKITAGIPHGHFVRAVREDPVRPGLLFAATEGGVYISFDDGAAWQPFSLNLPVLQVSDLTVRGNDLVISTFGRSFYLLEDLSPLRTLSPEVLRQRAHLFRPADVVRTLSEAPDGRRVKVPGANALQVHYSLAEPAREVSLDFLDARGRALRSFTRRAGDRPPTPVRDDLNYVLDSPYFGWAPPPPALPLEPGLHRAGWDLRGPQATGFPGMIIRGGGTAVGPIVPPGDYTVRLTVDGEASTQPFRVLPDPNLEGEVTVADLEAQYDLARRIHARLDEATTAVRDIRRIAAQVDDRVGLASNRQITTLAERVTAGLGQVEQALYEVGAQSQKDPLHFGGRLASKIATLLGQVVESADYQPTASVQAVFQELSASLDVELARLRAVEDRELGALNRALVSRGLPAVSGRAPVQAVTP